MKKYYIGSTPYLRCRDRNLSGALEDAGTSITITVYNPNWKKIVDAAAMTKDSTGVYHYAGLTMLTTHLEGVWHYLIKDTSSSIISDAMGEFEYVRR